MKDEEYVVPYCLAQIRASSLGYKSDDGNNRFDAKESDLIFVFNFVGYSKWSRDREVWCLCNGKVAKAPYLMLKRI